MSVSINTDYMCCRIVVCRMTCCRKKNLPTVVHGELKVSFQFTIVMPSKNQWEICIMARECW